MKVTNVSIKKQESEKVKGYATVVLDDELAIHNIRIIEGNGRLFVAMPSRQGNDGKYYDYVHPIVNDLRMQLEEAILKEFNK